MLWYLISCIYCIQYSTVYKMQVIALLSNSEWDLYIDSMQIQCKIKFFSNWKILNHLQYHSKIWGIFYFKCFWKSIILTKGCIYSSKHTLKQYYCELLLQFKATVCGFVYFVYFAISGKWVEFTVINIPLLLLQWIPRAFVAAIKQSALFAEFCTCSPNTVWKGNKSQSPY